MLSFLLQKLSIETREFLQFFFRYKDLCEAFRLAEEGKISISFCKGEPSGYFVISGIMRDRSRVEARVSSKIVSEKRVIQSRCNCSLWTQEKHCVHVASLCIKFYLQSIEYGDDTFSKEKFPYIEDLARVREYGTIIDSPDLLEGVRGGNYATWFTYRYLLSDQSHIFFPLPVEFKGKIYIELSQTQEAGVAKFSYITDQGERIEKISIFGALYLFDWERGQSYSLPPSIADFFKAINLYPHELNINDYLRLTYLLREKDLVVIELDGVILDQASLLRSSPSIFLQQSDNRRFFDFIITLKNDKGDFVSLFDELSAFSLDGGYLGSFSKKSYRYDFIKRIPLAVKSNYHCLNNYLRYTNQREMWRVQLDSLFLKDIIESYDREMGGIYFCETSVIQHFLATLVEFLGESSFDSSHFDKDGKRFILQVRSDILLENMSDLYEVFLKLGIEIYYNNSVIKKWRPQIQVQRKSNQTDWFEIDFKLSEEDLKIIQESNLENRQFFDSTNLTLLSGEHRDLIKFFARYKGMAQLQRETQDGGKEHYYKYHLSLNRSQIFELFEFEKMGLGKVLSEEEIELCERLSTLKELPNYEVPKNLVGKLRSYQLDAYRWLRFLWENRFGACLADDMGLGKTVQAISFLQSVDNEIERVMVVCPVSILFNWIAEFEKFSHYGNDICLYYGGTRKLDLSKKIILTSYGVVKREIDTTFKDMEFDILIMDEVQNLKNIRSLGAESIRKIKARFNLCLTGTPLENDITEFYNILDIAVPGIWGMSHLVKSSIMKQKPEHARKIARPFVLRRTKDQVLDDLPPKMDNTIFLDFSDEERSKYIQKLFAIKKCISETPSNQRYGEIFKGLLELRQLCLWQKNEQLLSTKIDFLFKNLDQILVKNHQVLIFSQFTTYLNIIQNYLESKEISFSRIDGSYSVNKRYKNIELFQSGKNKVFLISLRAGGQGLNLTAASYVYIMDPWWNPAVENQAVDRVYRIGQKRSVNIYRLIIKNSVEEKVLALQKSKKKLFDDVLGKGEGDFFQGKLSMKDFEALLSK